MSEKIDKQELYRNDKEEKIRNDFAKLFHNCPIPDRDVLQNLGLFLSSKNLSRILFMDHIYKQILDVHGIIAEFGTRWGQNVSLFSALRGIYEPFNRIRKVIGFDTFTGFPSVSKSDSEECDFIKEGGLACSDNYDDYLRAIMDYQEQDNPMSHVKKYEIIKGDASVEISEYLTKFPETIFSLVYFDFDIYKPTLDCLNKIKDRLVKGSVIAFDELCDHDSPGETKALQEVFGLNNVRLKRHQYTSRVSYFVKE